MNPRSGKPTDAARLKADVASVGVELLSARCTVDRHSAPIFSAGYCCVGGAPTSPTSHRFRRGAAPLFFQIQAHMSREKEANS
jgi:hypothetical protein